MQKIRFFFILAMLPFSLLAQQKTKIILQDSKRGTTDGVNNISYLKNPVFKHENATLWCDSAVYYESKNVFEAFKNVHINQGDTINIYSDHLTYDGNTKIAHLTTNVRMIDKESVLTTNILDYNMGTKVGTYVEGGKIVTKDVTLTSKNGYYFSNSRDAYFRYNVVAVTPQSTIKSDTLRYNTLTNWAYFYGPTNIKGKDDNLYTENGAYNTKTEYAYFGKKNLYTNGPKSLKGDSLYYDGIAGYGKAVKNIVFKDTTDKTVLYGQQGYYYKADERAVVTRNAYVGMGTKDSIEVNKKLIPDSLWMGADTLETKMVLKKTLTLIESPVLKKNNELGEEESPVKKTGTLKPDSVAIKPGPSIVKSDSTAATVTVKPDSVTVKEKETAPKKLSRKERKEARKNLRKADKSTESPPPPDVKTVPAVKDTLLKDSIPKSRADSVLKDSVTSPLLIKGPVKVTGKGKVIKDTISTDPLDTVRTRSIKAFHNVRVYKSNMQAVADSLFYTSADSTLRWYGKPILWSQGSQQTGDTIYLRLRNNKLNTLQIVQSGFIVNVNADSAKFNQIKGRLITAFFKDGELSTMFVDGNAESIYYNRDKDSIYTDMSQTVSSRIKILFKNKEITDILTIKDPEGIRVPVKEQKEEAFLTGFIWKPELRPLSKKEVITGKVKPKPAAKSNAPARKPAVSLKKVPADDKSGPVKKPQLIP